jgi:transcriptional regulator with XRE-family HTH domain
MARGYLRWSVKELGDKVGVAESTIKRMEQEEGFPIPRGANIEAVYKTLTGAGIEFIAENGTGGVGVRLRKEVAKLAARKKAAAHRAPEAPPRTSRSSRPAKAGSKRESSLACGFLTQPIQRRRRNGNARYRSHERGFALQAHSPKVGRRWL